MRKFWKVSLQVSIFILSTIQHKGVADGVLEAQSIGRLFSGHQLGKPSDVRQIMSTHKSSLVFIIHTT